MAMTTQLSHSGAFEAAPFRKPPACYIQSLDSDKSVHSLRAIHDLELAVRVQNAVAALMTIETPRPAVLTGTRS